MVEIDPTGKKFDKGDTRIVCEARAAVVGFHLPGRLVAAKPFNH